MGRRVESPQVVAWVYDGQEMLLHGEEYGMELLDHLERGQTLELAKLQ